MTVLTDAPVIPSPRAAGEAVRRPRRERPPEQYWDVFEARWRAAPR